MYGGLGLSLSPTTSSNYYKRKMSPYNTSAYNRPINPKDDSKKDFVSEFVHTFAYKVNKDTLYTGRFNGLIGIQEFNKKEDILITNLNYGAHINLYIIQVRYVENDTESRCLYVCYRYKELIHPLCLVRINSIDSLILQFILQQNNTEGLYLSKDIKITVVKLKNGTRISLYILYIFYIFYMYSKDIVSLSINLYEKYKNFRFVQDIINVSKSTIHRWFNNQDKYLKSSNNVKHHRTSKISTIIQNYIKTLVDNNPFIRLKNIYDKIKTTYNISISLTYISKIIKKLGYTSKTVTNRSYNKNTDNQNYITEFNNNTKNINIDNIVSIDESYFDLYNYPNKGKTLKGTKCIVKKPKNRYKQSLLLAITNKKVVKYLITPKNINTDIYIKFIKQMDIKNKVIICDNVSFHKNKDVIKEINKYNSIIFIPPYSPERNPIEFVFSEIKRSIRYQIFLNLKELKHYIINKLSTINSLNLKNYFNHSLNYTIKETPNITL